LKIEQTGPDQPRALYKNDTFRETFNQTNHQPEIDKRNLGTIAASYESNYTSIDHNELQHQVNKTNDSESIQTRMPHEAAGGQ